MPYLPFYPKPTGKTSELYELVQLTPEKIKKKSNEQIKLDRNT
jgi:hypothetical protein